MSTASTSPAEFRTDTRSVKQGFLFLAAFVLVAVFSSALYGGRGWQEALVVSASFSVIMLAVIWLYGILRMFDRRYVVSVDGVSLFRGEQLLTHISWSEVHSISRGHLQVCARSGRRIAFNLPPPIQRQARQTIDALFQNTRNA